jgi:hypothetical protein
MGAAGRAVTCSCCPLPTCGLVSPAFLAARVAKTCSIRNNGHQAAVDKARAEMRGRPLQHLFTHAWRTGAHAEGKGTCSRHALRSLPNSGASMHRRHQRLTQQRATRTTATCACRHQSKVNAGYCCLALLSTCNQLCCACRAPVFLVVSCCLYMQHAAACCAPGVDVCWAEPAAAAGGQPHRRVPHGAGAHPSRGKASLDILQLYILALLYYLFLQGMGMAVPHVSSAVQLQQWLCWSNSSSAYHSCS